MNELEISRTPELIGAEIRTLTTQAKSITVYYAVEIGRRLVEAKELCAHGEWLPFLKKETEFSDRTAARFMLAYRKLSKEQTSLFGAEPNSTTLSNLSISSALQLLTLPESERESFAEENDVEHLSVREVERLVKERTAELEAEKQKQALALASAESRVAVLQGELEAGAEELKKARGTIAELETRPVATVTERDEAAILAAANEAREEVKKEFSTILEDTEKALKEQEKQLAAAKKERDEALKAAAASRRDLEELKKAEEKAGAPEEAIARLRAQFEAQIKEAEERAEAAEKKLKISGKEIIDFDNARKRAFAEVTAMVENLNKIADRETAAACRRAADAMLEQFSTMFKGVEA